MSKLLFNNHDYNRHMPFIFEGNKLFYCRASVEDSALKDKGIRATRNLPTEVKYRAYNICVADIDLEKETVSNEIEMVTCPNDNVHCSPSVYRDHKGRINFIYTKEFLTVTMKPFFRAFRHKGEGINSLFKSMILPPLNGLKNYCVAESERFRVVASSIIGNAYILVLDKLKQTLTRIQLGLCNFIRRVSMVGGTNNVLLTYPNNNGNVHNSRGEHFTDLLNLETLEAFRVKADERNIYKCSAFGNKLVYAFRDNSQEKYYMDIKISDYTLSSGRIRPELRKVIDVSKWPRH